jgi:hypothetical protein
VFVQLALANLRPSSPCLCHGDDVVGLLTPRKGAASFLLKSLPGFQFTAIALTGRVSRSDVIFANQRRPRWCLPAGGPGFGDMREIQKKKDREGCAIHGLRLVMVVLQVRVTLPMTRNHGVAVLPVVVAVVAAVGVGIARSEVLTIGVGVELCAVAGVRDNGLGQGGCYESRRCDRNGADQCELHLWPPELV